MALSKLRVLDNAALFGLAYDTRFAAVLPSLATLKGVDPHCTPCLARKTKSREKYARVKAEIAALADGPLAKLKALLNAKTVRVYVGDGRSSRAVDR